MRILVKGAGVAGLATAHELAKAGAHVTLIERRPDIGGNASWLAGGMLAPYCEQEGGGPEVVRLGRQAADWWEKTLPGIVTFNGTLVVAPPRDTTELRRFAERTEAHCWADGEEIARLEPDLAGRFRTGLFFAQEAHLDPRHALPLLHEKLTSMGVDMDFGQDSAREEPFERIIDCTGFAAAQALADLRGVRGEMLHLETREVNLSRTIRFIHPRFPVYIVPRGEGRFMVGATMIESADQGPVSVRSMMELLNAAYALHPAFGEARIIEMAAGVRPAFPSNLPAIRKKNGTIFVNGFHRHGFLMAPALACQVVQTVLADHNSGRTCHEAYREWTAA
ncbi:glycine oxidase ThiO [Chelativorans sp. Marseille-P2723]|uniref:glycine oxidase ThiO n=1 Tax=Chelativorans sp. Marseille-P2723 TaxID=2709133 RepID=UPI00156D5B0D|nr:glycine oxidase ThiO [Chelativorans sp. Marseille-P2723]